MNDILAEQALGNTKVAPLISSVLIETSDIRACTDRRDREWWIAENRRQGTYWRSLGEAAAAIFATQFLSARSGAHR